MTLLPTLPLITPLVSLKLPPTSLLSLPSLSYNFDPGTEDDPDPETDEGRIAFPFGGDTPPASAIPSGELTRLPLRSLSEYDELRVIERPREWDWELDSVTESRSRSMERLRGEEAEVRPREKVGEGRKGEEGGERSDVSIP